MSKSIQLMYFDHTQPLAKVYDEATLHSEQSKGSVYQSLDGSVLIKKRATRPDAKRSTIENEVDVMATLSSRKLNIAVVPKVFGVGTETIADKRYDMCFQQFIKGTSLYHMTQEGKAATIPWKTVFDALKELRPHITHGDLHGNNVLIMASCGDVTPHGGKTPLASCGDATPQATLQAPQRIAFIDFGFSALPDRKYGVCTQQSKGFHERGTYAGLHDPLSDFVFFFINVYLKWATETLPDDIIRELFALFDYLGFRVPTKKHNGRWSVRKSVHGRAVPYKELEELPQPKSDLLYVPSLDEIRGFKGDAINVMKHSVDNDAKAYGIALGAFIYDQKRKRREIMSDNEAFKIIDSFMHFLPDTDGVTPSAR